MRPPSLWGDREHLAKLFTGHQVLITERAFNFRYKSTAHFLEVFRTFYGPVHKAFLSLEEDGRTALQNDLITLMERVNTASDGTLTIPGIYAEVIVLKA